MFKTPNSKSVGGAAVTVGAGVAGAKLSDGIVALMPDSTAKYRKAVVAVLATIGAASVDAKTTAGSAVQAAFAGMAIKQGTDFVTEQLTANVAPKDNTTKSGQFINAVVGHSTTAPVATAPVVSTTTLQKLGNPVQWTPAPLIQEKAPMPLGV